MAHSVYNNFHYQNVFLLPFSVVQYLHYSQAILYTTNYLISQWVLLLHCHKFILSFTLIYLPYSPNKHQTLLKIAQYMMVSCMCNQYNVKIWDIFYVGLQQKIVVIEFYIVLQFMALLLKTLHQYITIKFYIHFVSESLLYFRKYLQHTIMLIQTKTVMLIFLATDLKFHSLFM